MKLRVVIVDNKLSLFIEDGTYEQAAPRLAQLLKELGAAGIKLDSVSAIEQHKHDSREVRIDVRE